jgi:hypothetical protein
MSRKSWNMSPEQRKARVKKHRQSLAKAVAASKRKRALEKAGIAISPVEAIRREIQNAPDPKKAVKAMLRGLRG